MLRKKIKTHFVRFSSAAIAPTQGTKESAGFDLYSVEDVLISPSSTKIIITDIGFKIPRDYFGKIYSRTGFAVRFTEVGGGVIDADYRGPVSVIFFNFSNRHIEIEKGCRFAQIVFQKVTNHSVLREVQNFEDNKTQRGEGSFGSTGLKKHVCRQDLC